jgi:hypothetical protein
MREESSISFLTFPLRLSWVVLFALLSLAFILGWFVGMAPAALGWFGSFILFWICIPVCVLSILLGFILVVRSSSLSGIPPASVTKSYVLSPEELARWRSIKPGMDRHEVTDIIGQPDGPPRVVDLFLRDFVDLPSDYNGKMVYAWGNGRIYFEPNGGPVFQVKIPEYI